MAKLAKLPTLLVSDHTSASEVVREALRLMEERDQMQALHKAEIRKKIAAGVASLREDKSVDGEAFMTAMDAELAEVEGRGPV